MLGEEQEDQVGSKLLLHVHEGEFIIDDYHAKMSVFTTLNIAHERIFFGGFALKLWLQNTIYQESLDT